jgi:hydroxypyruvate isomerase
LPASASREQCLRVYEDNLRLAAERLHPRGIDVVIEPLNSFDVPGYLLDSFLLARSILSGQTPGIGLQFDAYHAARMGLNVAEEFRNCLPYVQHVQFADAPGRHEPGTGAVPFTELLAALGNTHYAGWLGAEYFPSGATVDSLAWLPHWRAATNSPATL